MQSGHKSRLSRLYLYICAYTYCRRENNDKSIRGWMLLTYFLDYLLIFNIRNWSRIKLFSPFFLSLQTLPWCPILKLIAYISLIISDTCTHIHALVNFLLLYIDYCIFIKVVYRLSLSSPAVAISQQKSQKSGSCSVHETVIKRDKIPENHSDEKENSSWSI